MTTFIKRALSAFILGPLFLVILWMGFPYAQSLICLLFVMCFIEWWRLCFVARQDQENWSRYVWFSCGTAYITFAFVAIFYLAYLSPGALMGLFGIIWASDIGAYLVGVLVGGPKCFPVLSPNKTWSGIIGGFLSALGVGYLLIVHTEWKIFQLDGSYLLANNLIVVAVIAIVSQLGDLLESKVKRSFGVKDTGNLIPGHGGILDRFDSPIAVGFLCFLVLVANIFFIFLSVAPSGAIILRASHSLLN